VGGGVLVATETMLNGQRNQTEEINKGCTYKAVCMPAATTTSALQVQRGLWQQLDTCQGAKVYDWAQP
jgi:hypothetical protein